MIPVLDDIEKLINERGSSHVLIQRVDLEREVCKLEVRLEGEIVARDKAERKLQLLRKEHEE